MMVENEETHSLDGMHATSENSIFTIRADLESAFSARLCLISPPRTGSTPVARILWEAGKFSHHCHEPFEARYWGGRPMEHHVLRNPMSVSSGQRENVNLIHHASGVMIKEMTFQMKISDFAMLINLSNLPIVFTMRDPRLSTVSRLKIVAELSGETTFPAEHSGWTALAEQVEYCDKALIPYVVIDTEFLRVRPADLVPKLLQKLGFSQTNISTSWASRPDLRLCDPEVGVLMGAARTSSDPFYLRVLGSD